MKHYQPLQHGDYELQFHGLKVEGVCAKKRVTVLPMVTMVTLWNIHHLK